MGKITVPHGKMGKNTFLLDTIQWNNEYSKMDNKLGLRIGKDRLHFF